MLKATLIKILCKADIGIPPMGTKLIGYKLRLVGKLKWGDARIAPSLENA